MDKKRDPISKIPNTQKQTQCFNGGVAQMVEQQPSKCEVLSSNHSTTKKKNNKRKEKGNKNTTEIFSMYTPMSLF
jgi:hypothetical protein